MTHSSRPMRFAVGASVLLAAFCCGPGHVVRTVPDAGTVPDAAPPGDAGTMPLDAIVEDAGESAFVDAGRDSSSVGPRDAGPSTSTVVGVGGMAAWDGLTGSERMTVRSFRSFFLHQSVGGDLEDGSQALGYGFEWAESGATSLDEGLNGGLFSSSNGDPTGKIAEFRAMAIANRASVRVAIMKFGYADVVRGSLEVAKSTYLAAVNDIKASGVRVLHITPPFVYDVPDENAPKMQMRTWMLETFPGDVIFDLEDIESTEPSGGARCERGGSWEICNSIRSTSGCPSLNQGVDAPSGQGHLCYEPHAQRIAKAFLYAIYLAGR